MENPADFSFRNVYTLQAQTPMIHFQAAQPGACLRATEVKPKLDRFLHSREVIPDAWILRRRRGSLNYQMRITALAQKDDIPHINACRAYFANLGDSAPKDFVFRDCRLEIVCFIPELLETIHKHIKDFFILHNFGTRQSKGFGSFLLEGTTEADISDTLRASCPHYFYTPYRGSTEDRLNAANAIYILLKNGINLSKLYPDAYIKGYAVGDFLPENIGSDKAFIKSRVLPADDGRDYPREGFTFIRALFGLAETYDFRDKHRNGGSYEQENRYTHQTQTRLKIIRAQVYHYEGTKEEDGKLSIPLESIEKDAGIRRFQSPFLIKIMGENIYFILGATWHLMLGQTFLINEKFAFRDVERLLKEKQWEKARQQLEQFPYITTPATFDPAAFISGFVDYFNAPGVQNALLRFPARNPSQVRPPVGCEMRLIAGLTLQMGNAQ